MNVSAVVDQLLGSAEPSVRWKVKVGVLGVPGNSAEAVALQEEIRDSERVRKLLANRDPEGRIEPVDNVYTKWQGAHWVLARLADIGYPAADASLAPVRDQVLEAWLAPRFFTSAELDGTTSARDKNGVPVMNGRHRRCASQQGNALYAIVKLGLDDGRAEKLAERLLHWQWPDGGWNCDKEPSADTSSFMETLTPMRGLAQFGMTHGNQAVTRAAQRAAEVFLKRRLFKQRSDGQIIRDDFTKLHYPLYWHYDVLGGLKVLAEAGMMADPRCEDPLDLLESKRMPDGGWSAEAKYYRSPETAKSPNELVDWGGTSKRRLNEWVTADALTVLKAAGRLEL